MSAPPRESVSKVMMMMTDADLSKQPLVRGYDVVKGRLPGADLPWLHRLRESGLATFLAAGLPSRKTEAWKYTDLRPLVRGDFTHTLDDPRETHIDRVPALFSDDDAVARLVFVDGHFRPGLSSVSALPQGVILEDLATTLGHRPALVEAQLSEPNGLAKHPLLALNTAYMDNGFVLRVPRGVMVERPIEIVALGGLASGPVAHHPRSLIDVEEGASVTVVENWTAAGAQPYLNNAALDVRVANDASLRHYRVQAEAAGAFHLATLRIALGAGAVYEGFAFSQGGRISRLDARLQLDGCGAHCGLGGAFLIRDDQLCDNTTVIEHRVPETSSREVFKGVIDGQARGVFQGRIVVEPGAQKTDGHQSCKTLLLSDGAEIDAKPELEIYADDVKCSHGATAGELSGEALFYLRCRGIDEDTARRLLIEAFVADALQEVTYEPMRGRLGDLVAAWMNAGREDRA